MTDASRPTADEAAAAGSSWREGFVIPASLLLAVLLFTAVVIGRGVGGHLQKSLGGFATFAFYLGLALVSGVAVWLSGRSGTEPSSTDGHRLSFAATAVAVVCPLLTAMILGHELSAGMLVFLWLMTFLIGGACLRLLVLRDATTPVVPEQQMRSPTDETPINRPFAQAPAASAIPVSTPVDLETPEPQSPEEETFSQRWTRRDGEMGDELEGTLTIFFAPGQRTATADIPIVPAMASLPDVDCEPITDEADVEVIVRSVHTYGVRLELQRPSNRTDAEEVQVAVLIHTERE